MTEKRRSPNGNGKRREKAAVSRELEGVRLLNMLDRIPQFVCLLSKDHSIHFANRSFRELFGAPRGQQCFETVGGQTEPCPDCPLDEVLVGRNTVVREWRSPSGTTYELHNSLFLDADGAPRMLVVGNDITDRIRAERELTGEKDKLQGILDGLTDGVYVVDAQHRVLYCNSAMAAEFGPVDGRKCYQYVHARSGPCPWCRSDKVLAGETFRHDWESGKAGKTYELVGAPAKNPDGSVANLHVLRDITERKRVEEDLRGSATRLQSLSRQLLQAQETERSRVSRELHDVLAQSLGTLKLRLSLIRNHLNEGQQEARTDCDDTLRYMDQAIETVRRLSRELSPTILADLGLGTALRRLISQFSRRTQTNVVQRIEDLGRLSSVDDEILVYRIFQEALYNIQKHARARNVSVILEKRDHEAHGLVEDDGVGFDRAKIDETDLVEKGLGLQIIAERIRMLGGTFDLESEPGKGTCITFSIPLPEAKTG